MRVAGVRKKDSLWKQIKKYKVFFVMTIPGVLYFFINNYLPMFGVIIAFKDLDYTKGIFGSEWIGFKNFEFLFRTEEAFVITRNTVLYNMVFIGLNLVLAVTAAYSAKCYSKEAGFPAFIKALSYCPISYLPLLLVMLYLASLVWSLDL